MCGTFSGANANDDELCFCILFGSPPGSSLRLGRVGTAQTTQMPLDSRTDSESHENGPHAQDNYVVVPTRPSRSEGRG